MKSDIPSQQRDSNHPGIRRNILLSIFFLLSWSIGRSEAMSTSKSDSMTRSNFFRRASVSAAITSFVLGGHTNGVLAFSIPSGDASTPYQQVSSEQSAPVPSMVEPTIAYRSLSIDMVGYDTTVPVAMWYPTSTGDISDSPLIMDIPKVQTASGRTTTSYQHRISVKRIGELLAGWTFIPEFVSKDFNLDPTLLKDFVVDGETVSLPKQGPVVFLAHGYLGSRFDLSHLAEKLAQQGFICVSPEYPESLAASYPRIPELDRSQITNRLLDVLSAELGIEATSYGIIGHSLGCGTAMSTGDETWVRVCIAGFPRAQTSGDRILFLTSMNDGAVSLSRFGGKTAFPPEYVQLEESTMFQQSKLPEKAALVFDRPDAPNHISFLSDSVNDAMIDLLSPLLPVAQTFSIPVLDFDKYQVSRDSRQTADVVIPLVTAYLKQNMM